MATVLDTFTFPNLTAQPFGYDAVDTESGLTARKWTLSGLLKPSEWAVLTNIYNGWRNARIQDEDTTTSGVIGTTIYFSSTGAGQSWSNVACWFTSPPEGTQVGRYISATVTVVDAAQKLAVILKQEEARTEESLPDLGTFNLGGAVLTLLKPADTYQDTPTLELTATGNHVIRGPLQIVRVKDIEGTTNAAGWNTVRAWYEATIVATPAVGAYYPLGAPIATATNKIINGVTSVQYTVSIQLGVVV